MTAERFEWTETMMLDCGGPVFVMQTDKGEVRFEWHHYCGPLPVTRTGSGRNLPSRHPFWRAVSLWDLQGRQVENGYCIWREPKEPVLQHIAGRHYLTIEDGEPGHDW
jgi:hypothetical protein